ncbi:hypothetical protein [Nocardioides sp.]|uniref:hypothetical protein n=1 Tax=Nocardioides sp. TaxID=35761 RepID=UPI002732FB82|nr:hypothetical protein [Nocardioides sp.]MDP3892488.1 hypothetical protein [Nocardioides sp.]
MKKFLATAVATVFVASGLVALAGTSASADPYPGTVPTNTVAKAKNRKVGQKVVVRVAVTAPGNVKPTGRVDIVVKRKIKGTFVVLRTVTRNYSGDAKTYKAGKVRKRGKYRAVVKFVPPETSMFQRSKDADNFRVRRR